MSFTVLTLLSTHCVCRG